MPTLLKVREEFGNHVIFKIVVGGLRSGTVEPLASHLRDYILHHWREVHTRTGQPFNETTLSRPGFVYDTDPACQAVTVFNLHMPEKSFNFFERLQQAFYADGQDITEAKTLTNLAVNVGMPRKEFQTRFEDDEVLNRTKSVMSG